MFETRSRVRPSDRYMPSRPDDKNWDFSQVYDLISLLSTLPNTPGKEHGKVAPLVREVPRAEQKRGIDGSSGVGDFAKIWEYLGVSSDAPAVGVTRVAPATTTRAPAPPTATVRPANIELPTATPPIMITTAPVQTPTTPLAIAQPLDREAYASDGAIYSPPTTHKGVKWRDEVSGADAGLTDALPDSPPTVTLLTKTQRKKQRRRQAKLEQEKTRAQSDFESESELQSAHKSPAKKASVHTIPTESELAQPAQPVPRRRYNLRSRTDPVVPVTPATPAKPTTALSSTKALSGTTSKIQRPQLNTPLTPASIRPRPQAQSEPRPSISQRHSVPLPAVADPFQSVSQEIQAALQGEWQPQSQAPVLLAPFPSVNDENLRTPQAQAPRHTRAPHTPTRKPVKPLVVRPKDERNWAFRLKLLRNFAEDRSWLIKLVQHAGHTSALNGIHVFIDFSNIWIGFMEYIKLARGLPPHAQTQRENIDFESLVLLLERGRPVAKRVLAGSAPLLPAFDEAKSIGYETNILDRVYKAKELTERQRRFQARHRTFHTGGDASSGSETTTAVAYAPEKWVEQGVDEILHLKILESVVDVEEPTTIVLGTGDAAEAEYSQGFMRMVERALKKGWKIELVSWSKNISFAYRNAKFQQTWGDKFRIIELDDYAEDLLDTQ